MKQINQDFCLWYLKGSINNFFIKNIKKIMKKVNQDFCLEYFKGSLIIFLKKII